MRVLVVSGEPELRAAITRLLQPAGYAVELATGAKRARELTAGGAIAAAIIAPRTLGIRGVPLARELRTTVSKLVVLADRRSECARLGQLLPGADIGLWPAPDKQWLLDRLCATQIEQTAAHEVPSSVHFEKRVIDIAARTYVDADGREQLLTRAELELLLALARSPGRILSRDRLRYLVGGRSSEPYDRSIDMLIARLRRKIESDPAVPRFVVTAPGEGYRFAVRPQSIKWVAVAAEEAQSAALQRAERRQLTVMACHITGFADQSNQSDPEELREISAAIHRTCVTTTAPLNGKVMQFLGDQLLIYFGYPDIHEDDAQRAILSSFELLRALREIYAPSLLSGCGYGSALRPAS